MMSHSNHSLKNFSSVDDAKSFFQLSYTLRVSNSELHTQTLRAAAREKTATLDLLEYLAEVDRRRLYAEKAYSSLWEYVHKALGYSEAQASERVSAMRLMKRIPEVKEALKGGALTLTSTAKLACHVRREKSNASQTLKLLEKCQGRSTREVERVLVENSTQSAPFPERVRAVTPEITRLTLEVDEEFMKLVQRMKELKGNPALELREVFQAAMFEFIKKREPKLKEPKRIESKEGVEKERVEKERVEKEVGHSSESRTVQRAALSAPEVRKTPEVQKVEGLMKIKDLTKGGVIKKLQEDRMKKSINRTRYLPVLTRTQIRLRSQDRCEFIDTEINKRCESRSGLEFDHIETFGKGGNSNPENLRHLCKTHNLREAVKTYGTKKMEVYLKRSEFK